MRASSLAIIYQASSLAIIYQASSLAIIYQASSLAIIYQASSLAIIYQASSLAIIYQASSLAIIYQASSLAIIYQASSLAIIFEFQLILTPELYWFFIVWGIQTPGTYLLINRAFLADFNRKIPAKIGFLLSPAISVINLSNRSKSVIN